MRLTNLGNNQVEVSIGDTLIFFSYNTAVAACVPALGYVRTEKMHSRTTLKHISQWLTSRGARDTDERPQRFFDDLG